MTVSDPILRRPTLPEQNSLHDDLETVIADFVAQAIALGLEFPLRMVMIARNGSTICGQFEATKDSIEYRSLWLGLLEQRITLPLNLMIVGSCGTACHGIIPSLDEPPQLFRENH